MVIRPAAAIFALPLPNPKDVALALDVAFPTSCLARILATDLLHLCRIWVGGFRLVTEASDAMVDRAA